MSPPPFGSFSPFCSSPQDSTISTNALIPQCNLFFRALLDVTQPPALTTLFPFERVVGFPDGGELGEVTGDSNREDLVVTRAIGRAGTGVGVDCDVGRMGVEGSLGDIAQLITSIICFLFMIYIIYRPTIRRAAVGRVEIRYFFILFALTLPLRILTTANVLTQGSSALVVLSSIHIALNAGTMWILIGNGIVATQIVPDGTLASLIPLTLPFLLLFSLTTYLSLDQAFGISSLFTLRPESPKLEQLRNIALWVLTVLWPYTASTIYTLLMLFIVRFRLGERTPCLWFALAWVVFGSSQVVLFLTHAGLCKASDGKLTSGFLNTLLETASVLLLFIAWTSITEAEWDESGYGQEEYLPMAGTEYKY